MGSASSKAARTASNSVRKYPTRVPPQTATTRPTNATSTRANPEGSVGPTIHPQTSASHSKDEIVIRDASDPDLAFNARLSQLGPVQPSPTISNSSTFDQTMPGDPSRSSQNTQFRSSPSFQPSVSAPGQSIFPSPASNPAVTLLTARSRLAQEAEDEFEGLGRRDSAGRGFLDVDTLRRVLTMRDERGTPVAEIEKELGLKSGTIARLGKRGVFSGAGA